MDPALVNLRRKKNAKQIDVDKTLVHNLNGFIAV